MAKFDIDYWSRHVIDKGMKLYLIEKSDKGVIWEMRNPNHPHGFLSSTGYSIFFLSWEEHSVFLDFLLERGYKKMEKLLKTEFIPEVKSPFDLPHILFRLGHVGNIRFYNLDGYKYLGETNQYGTSWEDSERILNGQFFSFGGRKNDIEKFVNFRCSPNFPLDKYKKVLQEIKRSTYNMHSKVQLFFFTEGLSKHV